MSKGGCCAQQSRVRVKKKGHVGGQCGDQRAREGASTRSIKHVWKYTACTGAWETRWIGLRVGMMGDWSMWVECVGFDWGGRKGVASEFPYMYLFRCLFVKGFGAMGP